jgi:hypothetical protein
MKKLITFSLFGNAPMYQKGAIENLKKAQSIYPDWICRFYLFEEDHFMEEELKKINSSVEIKKITKPGGFYSTLYRFLPLSEEGVERFISRDTDSRLSFREKEAVDAWIQSDRTYHIMKDHPYHFTPEFPILAGMWGGKGNVFNDIKYTMTEFVKEASDTKGIDQRFLYDYYHEVVKGDYLEHAMDSFPSARSFNRDGIYFVGQPIDEDNKFTGDWINDLAKLGITHNG